MGRLSNGAQQSTWCDVCGASIMGDRLTQTQQGHFEGTTVTGVPYAGTYVGDRRIAELDDMHPVRATGSSARAHLTGGMSKFRP